MSTSERLASNSERILARWETAVRQCVSAARHESRLVIRDDIPDFLQEMAEALDAGHDGPGSGLASVKHARQRALSTSYSLEQVVQEYGVLQDTVLEVIEESGPVPPADRRIILHAIQQGIGAATTHFVQIQEASLRESEERFRLLVDSAENYALFMLDPGGLVTSWNAGAQRIAGYSPTDIIGQPLARFYEEADVRQGKPQTALKLATEQGRFEDEGWRRRKDGSRLLAHVVIAPMRDARGRLKGFALVLRDMSERAMVDERFRSVVETVLDGLITIDEQASILSFNSAAQRLFGYTASEVLGRNVSMLMPQPYRKEHDGYMHNYARTGVPKVMGIGREVVGLRKDGSTFPMELAVGEFHTAQGRYFTGIVRDITERKQMAQELHRRANALEAQNKQKDEFLAMLGHELRNPLAAVSSATEVLRLRGAGNPAVVKAQHIISRQLRHLVRIVDDLLDVARLSKGLLRLKFERQDLRELLAQAVETTQAHMGERQQQVLLDLPDQPVLVTADATRIIQTVANLLHNASKFSGLEANIRLSLRVEDGEALVSVEDPGAGIPVDMLQDIFRLFGQGKRWVNNVQSGLGIGLQLVKALVEMHGGTVSAHSEGPGTGSRFDIRLPVLQAQVQSVRVKPLNTSAEAGDATDTLRRVLVVDDNRDAAVSLKELLEIFGSEARVAYNGTDGAEMARSWHPDLVLLDISMPDIDGYEVARRIRADPTLDELTVVALTGYGQEGDVELARQAGFDHHLTKPVDLRLLEKLLHDIPVKA